MSSRRTAAKIAQQAERKMENMEVPTVKETAEKATQAVKAANNGMHNIRSNGPFF